MKTIYNYAFKGLCLYLLIMVVVISTSIEIVTYKTDTKVFNENIGKQLQSSYLTKIIIKAENITDDKIDSQKIIDTKTIKKEDIIKPVEKEEKKEEPKPQEEPKQPVQQPSQPASTYQYVGTMDTSGIQGNYITTGSITHYGHDCCSGGKTATGYNISDGRIYYTDPTYGSVRIVAAGRGEFPYGTIVRLTGYSNEPIIAIVLDCGGISIHKEYKLDLLVESEKVANQLGVRRNVNIEVLRYGY